MKNNNLSVDMEEMKRFIKVFSNHSNNSKAELQRIRKNFRNFESTWKGSQADRFGKLFEQYYMSTNKILNELEKELIPDLKKQHKKLEEYTRL